MHERMNELLKKLFVGKMRFLVLLFVVVHFFSLGGCKSNMNDEDEELNDDGYSTGSGVFLAGYLPHYGMSRVDMEAIKKLQRTYYFSLTPDENGQLLVLQRDIDNIKQLSDLTANSNNELFVVVGGWKGSEYIHKMAASAHLRSAFVSDLLSFCLENKVDGVDLDWENYPHPFSETDYVLLVGELSESLRAKDLGFTIALGVVHAPIAKKVISKVDQINIMSYGKLDAEGNHATFSQMTSWLESYHELPKEKLIFGLPFYGKRPIIQGNTSPIALPYSDIVKQFRPKPSINKVDLYSFNGRDLMEKKIRYLKEQEYFGITAWEVSQDVSYSSEYSLLKVIVEANQ